MHCVAGTAFLVIGYVPVALSKSEGASSVQAVACLPGAHLYIQVLGNKKLTGMCGPVTPYDCVFDTQRIVSSQNGYE